MVTITFRLLFFLCLPIVYQSLSTTFSKTFNISFYIQTLLPLWRIKFFSLFEIPHSEGDLSRHSFYYKSPLLVQRLIRTFINSKILLYIHYVYWKILYYIILHDKHLDVSIKIGIRYFLISRTIWQVILKFVHNLIRFIIIEL